MYLIVQIPCLNEEDNISEVINAIPRDIEGVDRIDIMIIDDGSTDRTAEVSRESGADIIISHGNNKGLARSFQSGLNKAIELNADILVNTDGDHQYPGEYIPRLIGPLLGEECDVVIGDRLVGSVEHFSKVKRVLQLLGSFITRFLVGDSEITDAVSGFRAYNRVAMYELNITSNFSYVLDSIVQASSKRLQVKSVSISTNLPKRESRLFNGIFEHIRRSGIELLRVFALYKPLTIFMVLGVIVVGLGAIPLIRFLYDYFFITGGEGKVQSLIIGSMLISLGFNLMALGVIGDLLSKNRLLIERILNSLKAPK